MKKTKVIRAWIAKNEGDLDIQNVSIYSTEKEAKRFWGKRQEIIPVEIKLLTPKKARGR